MENALLLTEHVVALIGHLAWPLVVLVLVYLARREFRGVIDALAARIRDRRANIALGKDGLKIETQLDATQAKVESLDTVLEQVKSMLPMKPDEDAKHAPGPHVQHRAPRLPGPIASPPPAPPDAPAPPPAGAPPPDAAPADTATLDAIPQPLRTLADDYLAIDLPDYRARVRAKDAAARTMANYVITHGVSRDALADEDHEGLVLALAGAVHAFPEPGDLGRLLRASRRLERLHVKYRVVMALGRLFERDLATADDVPRVARLLDAFEHDADASLLRRIKQTRALVEQETHAA